MIWDQHCVLLVQQQVRFATLNQDTDPDMSSKHVTVQNIAQHIKSSLKIVFFFMPVAVGGAAELHPVPV